MTPVHQFYILSSILFSHHALLSVVGKYIPCAAADLHNRNACVWASNVLCGFGFQCRPCVDVRPFKATINILWHVHVCACV